MFEATQQLLAAVMIRVRVNRSRETILNGVPMISKTRRRGAGMVIAGGNVFLALARSGVRMFARAPAWIAWEMHCTQLLYPDEARARAISPRAVALARLPGMSLRQMLRGRQPLSSAFRCAAIEIGRAHQLECPRYGGRWSHGDLHLDNVLYDAATGRVCLVDFDTRHVWTLPAEWRQADDLLVLLLDLLASDNEDWRALADAFLAAYPDARVLAELERRLTVPRGFARTLFHTRTGGKPTRQIEARMQELRPMVRIAADRVAKMGRLT